MFKIRVLLSVCMMWCANAFASPAPDAQMYAAAPHVDVNDKPPVPQSDAEPAGQVAAAKKNSFNPLNLISINTDNPLDLNWTGALELSDPTMRPTGVVIPFLEQYPIENLEVKFKLLNLRF